MESKRVGPARRRLLWAAAAAGLIAVTAVVASSVASATPFLPNVPGYTHPTATEGTVRISGVREFPVIYASEGSSSNCHPGLAGCKAIPHVFTLTKQVDATTPVLAQSAATAKPYSEAVIVIRSSQGTLITYTLHDVRVADDNQQFETTASAAANAATLKEQVTFAYSKIEWSVGSVKAGYDWATATKT